jgi:hypothetical protein
MESKTVSNIDELLTRDRSYKPSTDVKVKKRVLELFNNIRKGYANIPDAAPIINKQVNEAASVIQNLFTKHDVRLDLVGMASTYISMAGNTSVETESFANRFYEQITMPKMEPKKLGEVESALWFFKRLVKAGVDAKQPTALFHPMATMLSYVRTHDMPYVISGLAAIQDKVFVKDAFIFVGPEVPKTLILAARRGVEEIVAGAKGLANGKLGSGEKDRLYGNFKANIERFTITFYNELAPFIDEHYVMPEIKRTVQEEGKPVEKTITIMQRAETLSYTLIKEIRK